MKRRSIKSLEGESIKGLDRNIPNLILFWTLITKFLTVKFGRFKKFAYLCRVIQNGTWCSGSHMRFWLL